MKRSLLLVLLSLPTLLSAGEVRVLPLQGIIQPVTASYIVEQLDEVTPSTTSLVIIELDTPGGLGTSMKEITTAIMNAPVPVCVYVFPPGSHAASAGFFILQSADIAAMAPSTTTGAAHPVNMMGKNSKDDVMLEKVTNDFAAQIRTMADTRHRNVELAEKAVREAVSFTEKEAWDNKVIDIVATNLEDLLKKVEGREIVRPDKSRIILHVKGAAVTVHPMSFIKQFLCIIVHPNIAFILMGLGMLGLYVEFTHPGVIFPGVTGALCLLLGLYALSVLPVNFVGLGLILLGVIMFILEVKVVSYGMLTIGGLTSFIIGSLMLFNSPIPEMRISFGLIILVALVIAAMVIFLGSLVVRAHRQKPSTGISGLTGEIGVVAETLSPRGKVFIHGEYWNARADGEIAEGQEVVVTQVDGMVITVRPISEKGGNP